MLIHLNADLAVDELFPNEMKRCNFTLSSGAKHSFSWVKYVTFLDWSFLNYCLQKASKPEVKMTQKRKLAARIIISQIPPES